MPVRPLWHSRFVVPLRAVELFLEALDGEGISVSAFEEPNGDAGAGELWLLELIQDREPDRRALAARLAPLAERSGLGRIDLTVAPMPSADWLARTAEGFPPQAIGRFWIRGTHVTEAPPRDTVAIRLDAGLAFGSGEHATTQGCLLALDHLARRRRFKRVLDLGCGSGILAIAVARLWPARVVASDNDPVAVEVARRNAAINQVAHRIRCVAGDGYSHPAIRAFGPYELICANILADPLCDMARETARHLAPGGIAVLSGLLDRQAARVLEAHRRAHLRPGREITIGIWTTLVVTQSSFSSPVPRPRTPSRSSSRADAPKRTVSGEVQPEPRK
ncbi:MAG: 50S ribosomal protein L11 methyltransferase [Geminicoccaceae bacterium]